MENIDLDILKFMSDRDNYYEYKDVIHKGLCTKESWTLVGDFGRYFDEYPTTEIDKDFPLWFRVTGHPGWKPEEHKVYGTIIRNVQERDAPDRQVFVDQLARLRLEAQLRRQVESLSAGDASVGDVLTAVSGFTRSSLPSEDGDCAFTLDDLALSQRSDDGYYWRLEDLNQAIGPIRDGDFTIVAKRPEVGGTSFICSEMSYMVEQMPKGSTAILFNNEEAPDKVYTRMVSAAIGVDYRAMMNAPKVHQQQYEKWLDGRDWTLSHSTSMDISSIRRTLKGVGNVGLIGINVLLKVGGTGKQEDHDKFQALGEEMRRIAQEFGPVIAVVQADPSAEGMRYIPQDRIYKSKTALQGEADVLIMIGSDDDGPVDSRYIHVAKNKIPPAPCCDLAVKHIKSEVKFDMGTGRFKSCNYKGNSRCTK